MDRGRVRVVFFAEPLSQVLLLRCDQNGVAGHKPRDQEHEQPRQIERQRDPRQNTNAAEVEPWGPKRK